MLAAQREQSGQMEQIVLQLQLQMSDALAERSSPPAHKRPRRGEVVAVQQQQEELMSEQDENEEVYEDEDEDKEEDEGGQQLFAPVTTYHPEQLEATTMDLFSLDDGLQPLQNFDASRLSRSFEPSEPSPRRVSDSPTLELA